MKKIYPYIICMVIVSVYGASTARANSEAPARNSESIQAERSIAEAAAMPGSSIATTDPTALFLQGEVLQRNGTAPIDPGFFIDPEKTLSFPEKIRVADSFSHLLTNVPPGNTEDNSEETLKSSYQSHFLSPIYQEYKKIKKKLNKSSLTDWFEKTPSLDFVEQEVGVLDYEGQGPVLLTMQMEVTDQVVNLRERLLEAEANPLFSWLFLRLMEKEEIEMLRSAEARRTTMDEAAKEAEKLGRRILFIVNGKPVNYYFNIPLFMAGSYKLIILNDAPPISQ